MVALMPLRGGSRSIPDKNTKSLAGRPLFAWSLREAVASGCFDSVYAATDSEKIRQAVRDWLPEVTVLDRSAESSTDTAPTEAVMEEFQARVPFDTVCLVQATSPLTRAVHFREAKAKFESGAFDSLLTAAPLRRFFWSADGKPLNYDPGRRPRRQDFAGQLTENGAFYLTNVDILGRYRCRLGGRVGVYEMSENTLLEIDEPSHWAAAEHLLLEELAASRRRRGGTIRALVLDVDGTLTDGGMYYGRGGEAMKRFDTRDAAGLHQLRESGVRLAVITGENSGAVAARMEKLRIDEYHPGVEDKAPVLEALSAKWKSSMDRIAYMGDDLNDEACLRRAGFSVCPADAIATVRRVCDYTTSARAGAGAVREACDLISRLNRDAVHGRGLPK